MFGGAFNALVAPLIFKGVIEYPLVIAAAGFIRPPAGANVDSNLNRRLDWLLPPAVMAFILGSTILLKRLEILPALNDRPLICGLMGIALLAVARRPVRFGIGLLALMLVSLWYPKIGRASCRERV